MEVWSGVPFDSGEGVLTPEILKTPYFDPQVFSQGGHFFSENKVYIVF